MRCICSSVRALTLYDFNDARRRQGATNVRWAAQEHADTPSTAERRSQPQRSRPTAAMGVAGHIWGGSAMSGPKACIAACIASV